MDNLLQKINPELEQRIQTRTCKNTTYFITVTLQEARHFANKYEFFKTQTSNKLQKFKDEVRIKAAYNKAIKGSVADKLEFVNKHDHKLAKEMIPDKRIIFKDDLERMKSKFVTFEINYRLLQRKHGEHDKMLAQCKVLLAKMFKTTVADIEQMDEGKWVKPGLQNHDILMNYTCKKAFFDYEARHFYKTHSEALYYLITTAGLYSRKTLSEAYKQALLRMEGKGGQINNHNRVSFPLIEYNVSKLIQILLIDLDIGEVFRGRRSDALIYALCILDLEATYQNENGNKKVLSFEPPNA